MQARSPADRILLIASVEVLVFLFLRYEWRLLLLGFAGLLFGVVLYTIASWVERHTPLTRMRSYYLTLVLLAAILVGAGVLLAPRVSAQLSELSGTLPGSLAQAQSYLEQRGWGIALLRLLHNAAFGSHLETLGKALTETVEDLVVVAVIGFFGAMSPSGYMKGLLSLLPAPQREATRNIIQDVIRTLRWWLIGQLVPMAVLGILSMILLWAFGVKLAFILGLFTGLAAFIPYLGSVMSGIPAVLFAFQRGPRTALYVLILYTTLHLIEGYLLTPFVQRRAIRIPPILTILSQFFFWTFGGVLGVSVATPLAAVGLLLVKRLYLSDAPQD